MILPFKIAVRFLKSNKAQTILISLGIAVGVSVQIFIGSLIQGLQKNLINTTIGSSSQITVTSKDDNGLISDYKGIMDRIKKSNSNIINLSAAADGSALIKEAAKNYPVLVKGMNINDSNKIYNIKASIYKGKFPKNNFEILVGKDLQKELGLKLDDSITIIADKGKTEKLKITGFYDLKVSSLNKSWLITNIKTSQQLFSMGSEVTSIEMQLKDVFKSSDISKSLRNTLGNDNFKVSDWQKENESLLSGLSGQSASSNMIQAFVLIAVLLGIASVLAITVVQKSKQLGILKAMGIKDRTASLIFLFEGLILGGIGAILGIILGVFLGFLFSKFVLNPDGTPLIELYINYTFICVSAIVAIVCAAIAAIIPARSSSKLNPIEVIRNA